MNTITFSSFLVALFTSERVVVGFQSAVPRVRGLRPRKINAGALNNLAGAALCPRVDGCWWLPVCVLYLHGIRCTRQVTQPGRLFFFPGFFSYPDKSVRIFGLC